MLVCDLHCDLPYKVYRNNETLNGDTAHWSLKKLKNNNYIQFFAAYVDKFQTDNPYAFADGMLDKFISLVNSDDKTELVTDKNIFEKAITENKVGVILTIEGGEALGGNIDNLDYFYNKGVRFLTLTWNYPNQLGEGVGIYNTNSGLTDFGKKVVLKMSKMKMGIDVSHLTERGFWDVCETTDAAICATHSNSYSVCPSLRNLTDKQFAEIVKRGGLVGINMYPLFLNGTENADISDIVKHIEHFMSLGGEESLALGCDFDGINITPKEIYGIGDIDKLFEFLLKINYSEKTIAKIAGENLKNYMFSNIF